MKFRTDYVTNSSSSSFIVAFDTVPQNVEELRQMMFGDEETFKLYWGYDDVEEYSTHDLASVVFNDLQMQTPNDEERILDEFESLAAYDVVDYHDFETSDGTFDWDAYYNALEEVARKRMKEFMDTHHDKAIFVFEYEDKGDYAILEYGDVFDRLPHIRVNKH